MSADIEVILSERGQTHGPFKQQAALTQELKDCVRRCPEWNELAAHHKESIEMIFHKVARVVTGNPDFPDHWDDIAGYAKLSSKAIW